VNLGQDSLASTLTDQQRRAVATRAVSVVLSSGAGCGKTHVLTERYLAHLREGAEVGQVVAITFTERAARQMRARIRKAVVGHLRAAPGDDEAEVWARHLRGLEAAPISTIHAFCGTLLRQHAVEAGLDPRFDVLEEVLAVNLEAEAAAAALQRLLTAQAPVGEDLRRLVLYFGWRAVVEAIGRLLRAWDERPWQRWLEQPPERVAADWARFAREDFLPRHIAFLLGSRPALVRVPGLLRRHPPQPGPMSEAVACILSELPRLAEAPDLAAAVKRLTEAAKVGRVGAKAWPDPAVYEQIKGAFESFREELRGLELERLAEPGEGLAEAVEAGQRFGRVAREVVRAYRERKRLAGVVDFQDLLVLARDLLRDRPEVRARLQDRYRFLLIDELQDTDPVQMELVEYLCGGGLSAGRLFAVGDYKQSIYRFRGADVSLFQELRRRMPHEGRQGLTVNFRSQPALLDFTNALLGRALPEYEPLVPHEPQVNPGPCVEFLWAPRPDKVSVAEARALEADWLARRIASLVGREMLVVERDGKDGAAAPALRPVRAGDVVLLFRAMSNVHLYEAALRRWGLNYYLVGGRAFFAQQEIYDILNLLRALENPQDAASLAGTLRAPFCCVSDEALFVLARHGEGLWAALHDPACEALLPADQRQRVQRARRHLQRWRSLKDRLPIAGLLGEVFADSGYDAATQLEFLGERKLANLWKLLDLARTFDRSGLFGLAEFIARLGDLVRSQPREEQAATQPENADVVRLMSIHQAKGLEFPVVFVPDFAAVGGGASRPVAEWDPALGCVVRPPADEDGPAFPDFGWRLWQARGDLEEWHEDLRTLYVACTRARDYLVLSAALPEPFHPSGAWTLTLAERFDLGSGECLAPDVAAEHRPRVRVHDRRHLPPEPPPPVSGPDLPDEAEGSTFQPAPPPCRGRGPVAVAELEERLRGQEGLFAPAGPLPGAEEGMGPAADLLSGPERVLRAVLAGWDFRDPDGWRELLDWLYPAGGPAHRRGEQLEVRRALERFATSELRQQLAGATVCRREVEYLFDLGTAEEPLPAIIGQMDCLWRDGQGRWHLLFYTPEPLAVDPEAGWRARQAGLVLAAAAVRAQTDAWPRSVTLASVGGGGTVSRAGGRLPRRAVLAGAGKALREIAGRPVEGERT
jgi:ATP-dependent helicase/nuclease subunit A